MRWSERPPAVRSRSARLVRLHCDPRSLPVAVAHLVLVRCSARMRYFLRGIAIGTWLLVALFAAFMILSSSHLVLAVIASHVALPRWLFAAAISICYLVCVAVLVFAAILMWRRKLPGL
jgi:hypothetical protein